MLISDHLQSLRSIHFYDYYGDGEQCVHQNCSWDDMDFWLLWMPIKIQSRLPHKRIGDVLIYVNYSITTPFYSSICACNQKWAFLFYLLNTNWIKRRSHFIEPVFTFKMVYTLHIENENAEKKKQKKIRFANETPEKF